jgi:hypothetical protein
LSVSSSCERTSRDIIGTHMSSVIASTAQKTQPMESAWRWRAFLRSGRFAFLFFLVVTAVFVWPQITHMATKLPEGVDAVDTTRQVGEIAHNLLYNPLHIYDSPGLYPLDNDLALNEVLVAQGIVIAPVVWLTHNPVLAWNIVTFTSFFLSALAAWLLVRLATDSTLAGITAGITYGFSPWHYGQAGHLGDVAIQYMVFALFFLVLFLNRSATTPRLLDRRNILFLALFAFFTLFQALAVGYYAYYEVILFGIYLIYFWLCNVRVWGWLVSKIRRHTASRVDWRRLGGQLLLLAVAALAVAALAAPFLLPYTDYKNRFGFSRALSEVEYWSAGPLSLLRTTPTSWWYGPVEQGIFGLETSAEREMYPGVVALTLALVAVVSRFRRRGQESVVRGQGLSGSGQHAMHNTPIGVGFFLVVTAVGFVLSLGPTLNIDSYGQGSTGIPLPYRWLYEHVPGFDALRVPHRFDLFVMLGLGGCAGFGTVRLMEWARGKVLRASYLAGVAALVLLMFDFFAPGGRYQDVPLGDSAPPLNRWLAAYPAGAEAASDIPKDALLLELPVGTGQTPVNSSPQYLLYDLDPMRPMLNGSPNIIPPGYERLFSEMRRFPTPGTLDIVEGLGVKYLVVHTGGLLNDAKRATLAQEAGPGGRLELVKDFPDSSPYSPTNRAEVYRIRPSPSRFSKLRTAVPEGASILLADHPAHLRLYNTVLPALLGPNRHYFANFSTIYDSVTGDRMPARPGLQYDYASIYKGDDPTKYGFLPNNRMDIGDNDVIDIYHR